MAGHNKVGHSKVGASVAGVSAGDHPDTKVGFSPFECGCSVSAVHIRVAPAALLLRESSVQERQVRRVTFAFESLQVIAVLKGLRDIEMISRECHPFVIWQKRDAFFGAHVSKDDARGFSARVGRMANLVLERAAGGLRGSFQNSAVDVVFPAGVDETQAAFFAAATKTPSA